ncbi:MAG: VOC family protein [Pseudomonadota bacterium]
MAQDDASADKGRVTGIGGVFFLADEDHAALAAWYEKNLGIALEAWGGGVLEWSGDTAEDGGATVWHVGAADSDWFAPSGARFMINYRVDDMHALLVKLERNGVELLDEPEYHENGVFVHLLDPQGNKIELWEPKLWDESNKR